MTSRPDRWSDGPAYSAWFAVCIAVLWVPTAAAQTANLDVRRVILLGTVAAVSLFAVLGLMIWWAHYLRRVNTALRRAEERYRELVDNMGSGVAVFSPCNGDTNFTLVSLNRAAERIEKLSSASVQGRLLDQVFPGESEYQLLDVCRRVWEQGAPEFMPPTRYRRDEHESWRQAYVYRLPSDHLVVVYDDLTDKVRAVEALRESRARMNLALTGADLGMWEWDLVADVLSIGERWSAHLGYIGANAIDPADTLAKVVHPDDVLALRAALREHADGKSPLFECEHRMRAYSGEWVWVLARGKVVERATDGTALRAAGTYLDTTARKCTEGKLESTVHFLNTFLNAIPDPVFYKDARGKYQGCNPVFAERILGLPMDEIIGRGIDDLPHAIPPELAEVYIARDRQLLENPPWQEYEAPVRCADGVPRVFVFHKSVFYDTHGAIAGIVGVMTDITARKSTEEVLRRRDAILGAMGSIAERFLRVTEWEEHVDDALAALGSATGVSRIYVYELDHSAPSCAAMLRDEWSAPRCSPKSARPATRTLALDAIDDGCWARVLAQGTIVTGSVHTFEGDMRRVLLEDDTQSFVAVPIFVNDVWWGILGLDDCAQERVWSVAERDALSTVADIFGQAIARQRAERNMRDLQQRVQQAQKLESLAVMAGGIAHDFNNLLVGVLGYADLSLTDDSLSERVHSNLERIKTAAEHAAELTNQMLAYSGHGRYAKMPVDVNDLLNGMQHLLETAAPKGVRVVCKCTPGLPAVEVDPEGLRQVILSLVANAAEALPVATGTITVQTALQQFDSNDVRRMTCPPPSQFEEAVVVDVVDKGCGMDAATIERIFDPFFSTKFVGRGLGLAAVLGIVRAHNGAVDVSSQPGAGTRVRVALPCAGAVHEKLQVSRPDTRTLSPGATVLVVDDEANVRHVIQQTLERSGYAVVTACDGTDAVRVLQEHRDTVGAVLLDLTMPGLSARETLSALHTVRAGIPVFLMSGYTEARAVREFGSDKIAGFIQKPFTSEGLLAALNSLTETPSES